VVELEKKMKRCAMAVAFVACCAGLASGQDAAAPAPAAEVLTSKSGEVKYTLEVFASGLQVPWAMAFLPDGSMMLTERAGRVRLIKDGKLVEEPVHTVENVWKRGGENGLMGLSLHPEFAKNGMVYISYGDTAAKDIRVMRYVYSDGKFADGKEILTGLPIGANHAGCCLAFGPDGKLYVTSGETFKKALSQDMNSLGGKILRLNDDGTVPSDNPFVGKEGVRPEIWASGTRNAQGIDWQPGTGQMFETEHGPSGERGIGENNTEGDEFNKVSKGDNLGWPAIHHDMTQDGMVTPLLHWTPGIAPASGKFYRGDKFPALKGNFLVGGLKGNRLVRIKLDGDKVVSHETLVKGLGRIRAICEGPDGSIYFATSNKDGRGMSKPDDDRIFRMVPAQ
jgi:glucose/arabinose dehydrogenase